MVILSVDCMFRRFRLGFRFKFRLVVIHSCVGLWCNINHILEDYGVIA